MSRRLGATLKPLSHAKFAPTVHCRTAATTTGKPEGTIADSFASLSGQKFEPLEPRFAGVKKDLIRGHEDAVRASWDRLLLKLREEVGVIAQLGPKVVPEIRFDEIDQASEHFKREYRHRGVAVVRGVIPKDEMLQMKEDLRNYIRANPTTRAFPQDNPQVYELYWSPTQIRARSHPNMLKAQEWLLGFWHSKDPQALISTRPISYADRLRMRQPGDAKFALGPHVDGGSCERWELDGYGKGGVYDKIWQGEWEEYDPWESSCRLPVESDLYQGAGACSAFRMAQAWLAMSETGPNEGTLLVNPLLSLATAYFLLRPFFAPKTLPPSASQLAADAGPLYESGFLHPDNWELEEEPTSWLQGANPGRGQELSALMHPHLHLPKTMVHVPKVQPGDYVVWHCDSIHAVDKVHAGDSDSSVLYIPACPLTELNAKFLQRQRNCFVQGVPSPDFPGGIGESKHVGRASPSNVAEMANEEGLRAMGLEAWDSEREGLSPGEQKVLRKANRILGFR